ncbi:ABC transporter substrate-binding protein [Hyalangium rubrum]|uniref:ABC transporter substrate-binding protein n=1 Tax=Hyalangium rubrum TaxID=3103134 RepID=A0ABU5H240_9BACT|nr:ABC transporter substrate-binding protein [Hyalangium sp. s54d21]MDY7227525.1 ABC transporter substrate-binding protein [Hyalangium sp. s54d21]
MNARLRSVPLLAALVLSLPALAAPNEAVSKPVKTVVQSVRYNKDVAALKHFGGEQQARFLLGDAWDKGTEAQRKEFVQLFHNLFAKIAFPKVRDNFKNLASITYEDPEVTGEEAKVASTIVIDHPMKKQELKLKYSLAKDKAGWKVVDVVVLGDSMLTGIRDDQVRPLLKDGGWDALLDAMRSKDKELASVQIK